MNATVKSRSWDFSSTELPYQHQLFNSALRMTRSREDAEDLVQETYLRAYLLYGTYTEGTNLKSWLFDILTRTCVNAYRGTRQTPPGVGVGELQDGFDEGLSSGWPVPQVGAGASLLPRQPDHQGLDALHALPRVFLVVFLLADLHGLTPGEIAEALGIPVDTVMSRLDRARRQLERAALRHGPRRHHLTRPPSRVRETSFDLDGRCAASTGRN